MGEKKLREFLRKEKIDISHIRCIIVGCARAGKTTFLRRLENTPFEKLKTEVKSTEMADIYVNMFEVSEDGETIESILFCLKWKKNQCIIFYYYLSFYFDLNHCVRHENQSNQFLKYLKKRWIKIYLMLM